MIPQDRLTWMQKGSQHFLQWLDHVVDKGVSILEKDDQLLPHVIAQMTDAKLGGFANRLQNISHRIGEGQIEIDAFKADLTRMQLAAMALLHWEKQERMRQYDVAQYAGFHIKKEQVMQSKPLVSEWWTVGQTKQNNERITTISTWFYSLSSGFYVQTDHFFGNQKHEVLPLGNIYHGHLHRYPSAFPMRAVSDQFRFQKKIKQVVQWSGQYLSWEKLAKDHVTLSKKQPWWGRWPFLIQPKRIISEEGRYMAMDHFGKKLEVVHASGNAEMLASSSLDGELRLWALWTGKHFEVMGVYAYDHYILP